VDNTPVFDIKPYVPWDVPGYPSAHCPSALQVPDWVSDDTTLSVEWSLCSTQQLESLARSGHLMPFYEAQEWKTAQQALTQLLSQDPRSSHKGLSNGRGLKMNEPYRLVFCKCMVEFCVQDIIEVLSVGSVAENEGVLFEETVD
jgi:hypothetical protein